MTVLALDIATRTGVAVDHPRLDGRPQLSTLVLPRGEPDEYGPRFGAFERGLVDLIAVHRPAVVVFEAPLFGGVRMHAGTAHLLIGLASIAELVAWRAGLDVLQGNVQGARKHFCGSGRAKKQDVLEKCRLLGWVADNDNEGDAAALWSWQHHEMRHERLLAEARR